MSIRDHVVLLVGGVGGAKLAVGLAHILPSGALTIIVNTADDFEHLGLYISPDLDTVMYSLASLSNPETGWGLVGDTFHATDMVARYDGPAWFRVGDRDLGTSLVRTMMLNEGKLLSDITRHLSAKLGIAHALVPMSNQYVRTYIETELGALPFQTYFVRDRWQPVAKGIRFEGIETARPCDEVVDALGNATLVVFGPSNPFLSIDPILALANVRSMIATSSVPCVAVSPIIGARAIKGPAAKLMHELGHELSPVGIARHYEDLLDGFILDVTDEAYCGIIEDLNIQVTTQNILMETIEDKRGLGESLLEWAEGNLT